MLKSLLHLAVVITLAAVVGCDREATTVMTNPPHPTDETEVGHELYLIAAAKERMLLDKDVTLAYRGADETGRRELIRRYEPDASFQYIRKVGPLDDYPTGIW